MSLDREILLDSYSELKPIINQVIGKFYDILLQKFPEAKGLMRPEQISQQKKVLIVSLVEVFEGLNRGEDIEVYLAQITAQYIHPGTDPRFVSWFSESMIDTLRYFFGESWSGRLESAWASLLERVAQNANSVISGGKSKPLAKKGVASGSVARSGVAQEVRTKIDMTLKAVMHESLQKLAGDSEFLALANTLAERLLQEALENHLSELTQSGVSILGGGDRKSA